MDLVRGREVLDLQLKRTVDAKKLLLSASKVLNGALISDSLAGLKIMRECGKIILGLLSDTLDVTLAVGSGAEEVSDPGGNPLPSMRSAVSVIVRSYDERYGRKLEPMGALARLFELEESVEFGGTIPRKVDLHDIRKSVQELLRMVVEDVLGMSFDELDYHLLIGDGQLGELMAGSLASIISGDFKDSIKRSALAFSISLENQRQRLNYLFEQEELSTPLFLLDPQSTLYYKLQDYSFILMALQIDVDKYNLFTKIVPTTLISDDDEKGMSITTSDYISQRWLTKKWARFCFDFVAETILQWERQDLREI